MKKIDHQKKKEGSNQEEISVIDIILGYLRYWKWFLLSVIICLLIGFFTTKITPKQYQSTMSILLNEDKGSSNNSFEYDMQLIGMMATTNNISDEIEILKSPDLMLLVVDSSFLDVTYYTKNFFRKTEIYSKSPFKVKVIGDKASINDINFYIQLKNSVYSIRGDYQGKTDESIEIESDIEKFPATVQVLDSTYLVIDVTAKEIVPSEKYFVTINNREDVSLQLSKDLFVKKADDRSSVLKISLMGGNSEKAAFILEDIVKRYNQMNVEVNNEIALKTSEFINERLKDISLELSSAESDVVEYKKSHNITNLSSEAELFVQQSGANEQKLLDIETQLNIINYVGGFVKDPVNALKLIPNLGISDIALSQIISEYNTKLLTNDALLKGTSDNSPTRTRVMDDLKNMRYSILGSIDNVKDSYVVAKKDLQKQHNIYQSRIKSVPQQEKGLMEKVREQQIKETLFLFLMQKREENNLAMASTANKARIIVSPRIDDIPVSPILRNRLLIALIIGLVIPVVVIYIIGLFRTKIIDRNELEKLSDVSIIGEVCKTNNSDYVVISENQKNSISEMFRSLRNNLNFIFNHAKNQVVIITSTISGEGKTFISINLCVTFALTGKKVLLIGADIRSPKLKNYLKLKNTKGLTDYLISSEDNYRDYIQMSDLNENLDIMIAGTIPPNPNELLMSPRLNDFVKKVKLEYDIVIIDSAPVGLVSDTYLLSGYSDVTLYVTREGVTPKDAVYFINDQKEHKKLKNMYLVFNGSSLGSNYKYGYGKTYGYEQN